MISLDLLGKVDVEGLGFWRKVLKLPTNYLPTTLRLMSLDAFKVASETFHATPIFEKHMINLLGNISRDVNSWLRTQFGSSGYHLFP